MRQFISDYFVIVAVVVVMFVMGAGTGASFRGGQPWAGFIKIVQAARR